MTQIIGETADEQSAYAKALGARLRAIRTQQGLSLHGVEEKSRGRWKAVVVGSYERGDRAVTVQRLAELADFYGVPVAELLPDGPLPSAAAEPAPRLVIDLEKLQKVPASQGAPLARYAATIQSQRGDYNGRVLSIRQEDLRSLAVIYDASPSQLTEQLITWECSRRRLGAPSPTDASRSEMARSGHGSREHAGRSSIASIRMRPRPGRDSGRGPADPRPCRTPRTPAPLPVMADGVALLLLAARAIRSRTGASPPWRDCRPARRPR